MQVPERAGPGPADPSSMMWMYHSHWVETEDTYAGLVGAIIITQKGGLAVMASHGSGGLAVMASHGSGGLAVMASHGSGGLAVMASHGSGGLAVMASHGSVLVVQFRGTARGLQRASQGPGDDVKEETLLS